MCATSPLVNDIRACRWRAETVVQVFVGFYLFLFFACKSSFLEYYTGFLLEWGPNMASLVLFKVT